MPILLKVRDISTFKYKSEKFMHTVFYISDFSYNGTKVYICIKSKLYLVEALKTNILIGNNILYMKSFLINLLSIFAHIQSCNIDIIINTKQYTQYLKHRVLANVATFISLKSKALISFQQMSLSSLCNFLFHSFSQLYLILYAYLIDYIISKIFMKNNREYFI